MELEDLTYIQGELSAQKILIRGGVTVGMVFFDESSVYGPALLDAYELESQHAKYPRIVLHPEVRRRVLESILFSRPRKSRSGGPASGFRLTG